MTELGFKSLRVIRLVLGRRALFDINNAEQERAV
jgi:hypothetical protein